MALLFLPRMLMRSAPYGKCSSPSRAGRARPSEERGHLLLATGADINHQNAHGNSPLHFAMAYDTEGTLGEYLIQKGADDQLENLDGMTPYDGIGAGA